MREVINLRDINCKPCQLRASVELRRQSTYADLMMRGHKVRPAPATMRPGSQWAYLCDICGTFIAARLYTDGDAYMLEVQGIELQPCTAPAQ
jgi:hypothetical protein